MVKQVFLIILLATLVSCDHQPPDVIKPEPHPAPATVLILTETEGYRHESIESGVAMFHKYEEDWGIAVTVAGESTALLTEDINSFLFIVLLSTTGDFLNDTEQGVLKEYVLTGGGVLGIHAATDAEYDWTWYGYLLGAWFDNHPAIQQATCLKETDNYNTGIPAEWVRNDEWYNFRNVAAGNNVLISLDEQTYSGGTMGEDHPISWYRQVGEGRVFYTGMGHTKETYEEPLFIKHIESAVTYLKK